MGEGSVNIAPTWVVTGMTCDHCVQAVTKEVAALPGVSGVEVDLATGSLRLESAQPVDDGALRAAVAEAGYEVTG